MRKIIPKLNHRSFSFKSIGTEAVLIFGVTVIFANSVIRPLIHPLLALPAIIIMLGLLVVLVLESETNHRKTTIEGMILYLKLSFKMSERKPKSNRMYVNKLKLINIFNKGTVKVPLNIQDNSKSINLASLEDAGIKDISDDSYTDKKDNTFHVFMFEYKNIVGISDEIDAENQHLQSMLYDSLESRFKINFPFYNNRPLQDAYDYFYSLMNEHPEHREEYEEMLMWMYHYNNQTQIIKTIDVMDQDLDNFLKNSNHLELYQFKGDELIKHLHQRQSGGGTE